MTPRCLAERCFTVLFSVLLVLPVMAACTRTMPALTDSTAAVEVDPWPRQLTSGDNTFSVFQPQYERWDGGRLDGRAAVAVETKASPQPTYGVIWFTVRPDSSGSNAWGPSTTSRPPTESAAASTAAVGFTPPAASTAAGVLRAAFTAVAEGTAEAGTAEVGTAEVGTAEVGTAEVGTTEVSLPCG